MKVIVLINKLSKNHHCIPQFYLNRFGTKQKNGEYTIFVYNKNEGKFFKNSVSNISYVKNYNTIKIDSEETDEFEKLHNVLFEKNYSKKLSIVIEYIENFFKERSFINCLSTEKIAEINKMSLFPNKYKYFLSILLAYFIKRSKKTRYFEEAAYDKMYDMMNQIYSSLNLDRNKFEENVYEELGTKEQLKIGNIISCFNEKELRQLANYLYKHVWNIGYNRSNHLLYTCDSAHALTNIMKDYPKIYGVGYASPGSMIMFPLTPCICILMYDPIQLEQEHQKVIDGNYVYLDENLVKFINEEITHEAVDEVYSQNGDWKHLKDFCKKEKIPLGHKPYSIN